MNVATVERSRRPSRMSSLLDCIVRAFWPHGYLRLYRLPQAQTCKFILPRQGASPCSCDVTRLIFCKKLLYLLQLTSSHPEHCMLVIYILHSFIIFLMKNAIYSSGLLKKCESDLRG